MSEIELIAGLGVIQSRTEGAPLDHGWSPDTLRVVALSPVSRVVVVTLK